MTEHEYLADRFEENRTHLLRLTIANGKITEIEVIGDAARLSELDLSIVD